MYVVDITTSRLAHTESHSLKLEGVDAELTEIGGRDPLRHRRSRASPLRRVYDRGSCACTRLCPE